MSDSPFDFSDEEEDDEDEGIANFTIVGNHFRSPEEKEIFQNLEANAPLKLELEPENPYDENAIKVLAQDDSGDFSAHVGYVPRTENEAILELIEEYGGLENLEARLLLGNYAVLELASPDEERGPDPSGPPAAA